MQPAGTALNNVGAATIKGFDADANFRATENITLFGSISYLDATYGKLTKPLLLVGGGRSPQCAQRILTRLGTVTSAVVHVVPSATHFLPITHGPELIEMLVRLWSIPESSVAKAHVGEP